MVETRRREVSVAFQGNKSPADYAPLAELAERLGFDAISVYADLGFQPAIVPLLLMAQRTRRIRLGPAGLNTHLIHPIEIAGQIAMLDRISGGRAYLGLVRGAWLDSLGIDDARPVARLREAIAVIRHLLSGRNDGFAGEFFRLPARAMRQFEVARPDVPILIGGWGPRVMALAGEVASELKIGGSANPAMVPPARRALAIGEKRAARRPGEVGVVFGAVTVVDVDGAAARARARREVARYLPVVARLDPTVDLADDECRRIAALVDAGAGEDAAALVPDGLLDRFAFSGTPTQIVEQAERLFAAGASRIEFGTPHGFVDVEGVRLLGERVLPALRSA